MPKNLLLLRSLKSLSRNERDGIKRRILAIFQRAEIGAVKMPRRDSHNLGNTSKPLKSLASKVNRCISYQSLDICEKSTPCIPKLTEPPLTGLKSPGIPPALPAPAMSRPKPTVGDSVVPIANPFTTDSQESPGLPDRYELEMYRLRRRVAELECDVLNRDDKIRHALATLDDELTFWRTGLHDHVWETLGKIHARVTRLNSTVAHLKEVGGRHVPHLDIPAGWRKGQDR